jgi:hypothetical protein
VSSLAPSEKPTQERDTARVRASIASRTWSTVTPPGRLSRKRTSTPRRVRFSQGYTLAGNSPLAQMTLSPASMGSEPAAMAIPEEVLGTKPMQDACAPMSPAMALRERRKSSIIPESWPG